MKKKKNRNKQYIGLAMIIFVAIFLAYFFITQSYEQVSFSVFPDVTLGTAPLESVGGASAVPQT